MESSSLLLLLLLMATFAFGYRECPAECTCNLDTRGRIQTICNRGSMKQIPILEMDPNTEVLIIRGPRNNLVIGPIFLPLKRLEILRITDSNLPSVGTYSFWGVERLRILDLSRNNITSIEQNNFKGQEHLDELDLSSNKISGLTSWVFDNLKDLRRLSLANNFIEKLANRVFYKVSKLKYLDLSANPLTDLPPEVFNDITDLKELRCRKCFLKEINAKLFQCIPRLTELDLGENYFKYIDDDDFKDLKRLTKLHLDGNQISVIAEPILPSQKSLEFLDLSYNRLTRLPTNAISHLSNLTALDLSYNEIHSMMPGTVYPWRNLHMLNISGNPLDLFNLQLTFYVGFGLWFFRENMFLFTSVKMVENQMKHLRLQNFGMVFSFNNVRHLSALSIADMSKIPMDFLQSFDQLKVLNLSGNHLENTSLTLLDGINDLELLDLSRNRLNGFDDNIVWKLRQIKDVKLESNPLICDRCHMGVLIDIAQTLQWNVYPICHSPTTLRGKPISDLNATALIECLDIDSNDLYDMAGISENILLMQGSFNLFAIVCAIALIITIIVLIVVLSVKNRHSAKYYTNEEKRNDGLYEKNIDTLSITGNELSYKFPIDDIIYTIDEASLQPSSQPPLISFTTRNG